MMRLHVMDNSGKVLGTLSVDSRFRLRLDLFSSAYLQEFTDLVRELTRSPLPLHTYQRFLTPDSNRIVAQVKYLSPSDPDFLWAVREYVNHHDLGELKVIGHLVDKPVQESRTLNGSAASGGAQ